MIVNYLRKVNLQKVKEKLKVEYVEIVKDIGKSALASLLFFQLLVILSPHKPLIIFHVFPHYATRHLELDVSTICGSKPPCLSL